uniref:IS110 family transposase n=1 Tax=Devosia beringensis TaxID=2657486 RepID=UPI001E49B0AB|nr:transposase [Devosia beringensis]
MIFSPDYVGVDVSKKHLDLAITGSSRLRVSNNPAGMARLVQKISSLTRPHLVCEATGSYTRLMARSLSQHGIALSTINPRRVRDLARADGLLAKTDAIDAAAILRFAHLMHPDPDPPLRSKCRGNGRSGAPAPPDGGYAGHGKAASRAP